MDNDTQLSKPQIVRLGVVVGVGFALANAAFYAVSARWSASPNVTSVTSMRSAFLALTATLGAASFGGVVAPRWIGHAIAFAVAISAGVAGGAAFFGNLPMVLAVTLIVIAAVTPALAFYSLRRSRAAWSALTAILAVLGIVTLFGAPKLRTVMGIQLATALIAPGLLTIAVIALATVRGDYLERG